MRVLYRGKVIDTDKHTIRGREIIGYDNWGDFEYLREQRTWAELQGGMQVGAAKKSYIDEKRRVELRRQILASIPE